MNILEQLTGPNFFVEVELANNGDMVRAEVGQLRRQQVRRAKVKCAVGPRTMRLIIPAFIAEQLGVENAGKAIVHYANDRINERPLVKGVHLTYGGRESVFTAIVDPNAESVVMGGIVLEDLDFQVDSVGQKLVPRDPKQIVSEAE